MLPGPRGHGWILGWLVWGGVVWAGSPAELKIGLGHTGSVDAVAFSPDGRFVLTGSDDTSVVLWDIATGREVKRFEQPDFVQSVGFSGDGRFIVSGGKGARVWDRTTGREVAFLDAGWFICAALSPDGRRVLTGNSSGAVELWDAATGRKLRHFAGHSDDVHSVAFSRDGRLAVTAGRDQVARVWQVSTGRELLEFKGHTEDVWTAAFSADGQRVATGSEDGTTRVWEVKTGHEIRRFTAPSSFIESVAFSPDGSMVVAGGTDKVARLWDVATGREIRRLEGHSNRVESVAFSPDGQTVLTGSWDDTARLWEARSGRLIRRFTGQCSTVNSAVFTREGLGVLTANGDHTAWLWDLTKGSVIRRFEGHSAEVRSARFSSDGRSVITSGKDKTARLWDRSTGRELRRFEIGILSEHAELSPDGKSVLTTDSDSVGVWDAATGREMWRQKSDNSAASFSPDGRWVLTADSVSGILRLWDAASGDGFNFSEKRYQHADAVAFSPDGRTVAIGATSARLLDLATRREIRSIGAENVVWSVAFSPDGRFLLTGAYDKTARLWDVATGREIHRFEGHAGPVGSVQFSPDGRLVLTGSWDGTSKIWDRDSGRLLVTLVTFSDGGWAVVDAEGRYDASDPENSAGLYWLLGEEVIELKQLKARFYTPDLLGRALGFSKEPLPAVAGLRDLELWPAVEVTPPGEGQTAATIRLTDRGGGIGRVVVKVNGREVAGVARGGAVDLGGAELAADGDNRIEVIVYGRDNLVAGRGVEVAWKRAPEKAAAPPALYAIVSGVSSYENAGLSLKFPAKDAVEMARALEIGGRRLFGVEKVKVKLLATGTDREPTKENIRKAFEEVAAKAGPEDVALVYLAGHGVAGKAGSDLYYYLTREARTVNPEEDARLWGETTVSSAELREWLGRKGMPLRQVVVLDTCAAGAATGELVKLAERRELTADQRRALELLKDATGSHILMGAAADKVSYEASRYGDGLLTYALLRGMRGEALDGGGRLDVRKWFDISQRLVPELAQGIGGIQQPVISSPAGQSFPIAMFTAEDRAKIELPALKPQLLPARVEDEDQNDPLQLEGLVREGLRMASFPVTRGEARAEPGLVYLDQVAGEVAGAYTPQVRYRSEGGSVKVRLRLVAGSERVEGNFEWRGGDAKEVARRIVEEFIKMAAGLPVR